MHGLLDKMSISFLIVTYNIFNLTVLNYKDKPGYFYIKYYSKNK